MALIQAIEPHHSLKDTQYLAIDTHSLLLPSWSEYGTFDLAVPHEIDRRRSHGGLNEHFLHEAEQRFSALEHLLGERMESKTLLGGERQVYEMQDTWERLSREKPWHDSIATKLYDRQIDVLRNVRGLAPNYTGAAYNQLLNSIRRVSERHGIQATQVDKGLLAHYLHNSIERGETTLVTGSDALTRLAYLSDEILEPLTAVRVDPAVWASLYGRERHTCEVQHAA